MIRFTKSISSKQAKAYFSDALSKSDYYMEGQELTGSFHGKLAERLGIPTKATKENFFALCENKHPITGERLTPRNSDDRITGYDITFSAPKSFSILNFLAKDDHLLKAFEESVHLTMVEIEQDAKTRVRKNGIYEDRDTKEFCWAQFTHLTSRPVENHTPDPHVHSHLFVLNATYDSEENKIKAAKFRDIAYSLPYYGARFDKRLSDKLIELGYQIRKSDKSWEIANVPKEAIELFSKRTKEIEKEAKKKGITGASALGKLGAKTRSKKQKGLTMEALKADWKKQLHATNSLNDMEDNPIRFAPKKEMKLNDKECVDYAIKESFERASVMSDRRVVEKAYRFAIGNNNVSLDSISKEFDADHRLMAVNQDGRKMVTTQEVFLEEFRMINLATNGKGTLKPLYDIPPQIDLKDEQAKAVEHVLTTGNLVSIIRGGAGTGKTTLLKEAVKHIENTGKKVIMVAPTAQASRGVLQKEGFKGADTVARLLVDNNLQTELKDNVLIVDEAGLLGTKDMADLIFLAKKQNARLILSGDDKQHSAILRGDSLRVLNTVGGVQAAEVATIYRQKNLNYRSAVQDISNGDINTAFEKLDQMGSIKAIDPLNPYEMLVNDYTSAAKKGKSALVISPTHMQAEKVTDKIRSRLKNIRKLGTKEIETSRLINSNFTSAKKSDWQEFKPGQVIQFRQNIEKIKRGSSWQVKEAKDSKVYIQNNHGQTIILPQQKSDYFDVYEKTNIALAKGDSLRITKNCYDTKNKRLDNGTSLKFHSIDKDGNFHLASKKGKSRFILDKDFGHVAYDYCSTSHSAQGRTVDEVFIAQPASTFGATNMKQFYVSVSRGKDKVHIYTDDKKELLKAASEKGNRQSAMELIFGHNSISSLIQSRTRQSYPMPPKETHDRDEVKTAFKENKDRDYEPGF